MKLIKGSLIFAACLTYTQVAMSESADTKIVGGTNVEVDFKDPRYYATVAITRPDIREENHSFCTGTLVAPDVVMTAAHCIVDGEGNERPFTYLVTFGNKVGPDAPTLNVITKVVHPEYEESVATNPAPSKPAHDIGLLKLESDAPEGFKPVEIFQGDIKANDKIKLAGFGVTLMRAINDTGILRKVDVSIMTVSDNLNRITTNAFGRGVCAGDSGGPAFVEENGEWFVTGVTSTGTAILGQICFGLNNFTDARSYYDWVSEAISEL